MECPYCHRDVIPEKKNKKIWYLFGFLPYLIYVHQKSPHHCPVCGKHMFNQVFIKSK